jgi:hypothetical protein
MPSGLRDTVQGRIERIVGSVPAFTGDNEVDLDAFSEALDQGLARLSRDKPYVTVSDEVGDGGKYYNVATLLTSWEDDLSEVLQVDYDAASRVSGDEEPQWLSYDDNDWRIYRDASARYLYFPTRAPDSGTTFRVAYTIRYTLTNDTSTVPQLLEEALVYISVSRLARIIQVHVEKGLDSPAGAQFVSMRNKGSGFAAISKDFLEMYIEEIGGKDGIQAAAVTRDFDLKASTGEEFMFHTGRAR